MARYSNIKAEHIPYIILIFCLYFVLDWFLKKQFQKYHEKDNSGPATHLLAEYFPRATPEELNKFSKWYALMLPKIQESIPYYRVPYAHLYTAEAVVELVDIAKTSSYLSTDDIISIYEDRRDIVRTLEEIIRHQQDSREEYDTEKEDQEIRTRFPHKSPEFINSFLSVQKILSLSRIQDIHPDASREEILQIYIEFIEAYDILYQKRQNGIDEKIYQFYSKQKLLKQRKDEPGSDEEKIQKYEQEEKVKAVFSLWEDEYIGKKLRPQNPKKNTEELLEIHKKQVERRDSQERMVLTQKALAMYAQKKNEIENFIKNQRDKNRKEALLWYEITQKVPHESHEKLQEYYEEQKSYFLTEETPQEKEFRKTSLDAQSILEDYQLDKAYEDWKKKYYIDSISMVVGVVLFAVFLIWKEE